MFGRNGKAEREDARRELDTIVKLRQRYERAAFDMEHTAKRFWTTEGARLAEVEARCEALEKALASHLSIDSGAFR